MKLSEPRTVRALAARGVRYVVVHRAGYRKTELQEDIDELAAIAENPRLRKVKTFPAEECVVPGLICTMEQDAIDVYELAP